MSKKKRPNQTESRPDDSPHSVSHWQRHAPILALLVCAIAAGLYLLWPVIIDPAQSLFAGDYNMSHHLGRVETARNPLQFGWSDRWYLGNGSKSGPRLDMGLPLLLLLPPHISYWATVLAAILVAAVGGWFCARMLGVRRFGAAIAGISFGLTGHFVTLINAGHIGKVQGIPWLPWVFGLFVLAWRTGRPLHFLLTAMAYGLLWLSGEPQVPLYLGFFLAAYALVATIRIFTRRQAADPDVQVNEDREQSNDNRRGAAGQSESRSPITNDHSPITPILRRIALSIACVLLTIILGWQQLGHLVSYYETRAPQTKSATQSEAGAPQNKEASYDFATGWSFPPEETALLVMSDKLFGLFSPRYWGRHGTKEFHMTEVGHYIGFLTVLLAGIACFTRTGRPTHKGFLVAMTVISLLIAYGRFTPFYRLIYALPTMSAQRVPARWIVFTAFGVSMLAGFGYQSLAAMAPGRTCKRIVLLALLATLGIVLLLTGSVLTSSRAAFTHAAFGESGALATSPSADLAAVRADLFIDAFSRTGWVALFAALLFAIHLRIWHKQLSTNAADHYRSLITDHRSLILPLLFLLFITVDLAANDKLYITTHNWKQFFQKDSIVEFMQADPDRFRIQTIAHQRHPYLGRFIQFIGPYHDLRFAQPSAVSRQARELTLLFDRLTEGQLPFILNPRYYDLFNVKYVFSAVELPDKIREHAHLKLLRKLPFQSLPPAFIYEYEGFVPNPCLVPASVAMSNMEAVRDAITRPTFDINKTVYGVDIPELSAAGVTGTTRLLAFERNKIHIQADNNTRCWLLLREKYDPDWRATVDGQPTEVYQVNALHCGIILPPGAHDVVFRYSPSRRRLFVTSGVWLIVLAIVGIVIAAQRSCRTTGRQG